MSDGTEAEGNWVEALYRRHAPQWVLYGRALGLSHAESEDVLQETFMALLKLPQEPEEPEFYGLRAFRNRALNHRRGFLRRLARELESRRWFESQPGESPRERAAMDVLTRLPREQREVIVLKIWHQQTFEAIGRLLDIPANTAAGRYRYGMQKLRAAMESEPNERTERTGEPFALLETTPPLREG